LAEAGWEVLVTAVAAAWPVPGSGAGADLARIVSAIPDGETVLIDGLIASPAAAQLLPHTGRIRMTVLLHMPLATLLATHPPPRTPATAPGGRARGGAPPAPPRAGPPPAKGPAGRS